MREISTELALNPVVMKVSKRVFQSALRALKGFQGDERATLLREVWWGEKFGFSGVAQCLGSMDEG